MRGKLKAAPPKLRRLGENNFVRTRAVDKIKKKITEKQMAQSVDLALRHMDDIAKRGRKKKKKVSKE